MKLAITRAVAAAVLFTHTASAAVIPDWITANNSPPPTDSAFIALSLEKVNSIRTRYSAPPLQWSAEIAEVALRKSNGCILDHSGIYGENAYAFRFGVPETKPDFPAQVRSAFDAWVAEDERTAYLAGDLFGGGHFTQTVWKSSRLMGCAFSTVRCKNTKDQEWWFYCDFDPAGNVIGDYERNVST
ncbi:CAP domain-containing protein [Podospora aff. communis PSN243]|uniref:CAP domain-containing protein n=1 Tax=Podospora aff. communis PSN243 TaxID=3040156 RepID=A0AAV9GTS1_9PEZI|nr:CAP domain-containing protein [Podospora aff. communis PSN243]